jgi:hypothetical protein
MIYGVYARFWPTPCIPVKNKKAQETVSMPETYIPKRVAFFFVLPDRLARPPDMEMQYTTVGMIIRSLDLILSLASLAPACAGTHNRCSLYLFQPLSYQHKTKPPDHAGTHNRCSFYLIQP